MLALTENAVDAVRRVLADSDDDVAGLRITVETGGCSGYRYKLGLESEPQEGDAVVEISGLLVFIDPVSQPLLAGAEIDFAEDVSGAGFVFNNPNAKSQCGCGKSFC